MKRKTIELHHIAKGFFIVGVLVLLLIFFIHGKHRKAAQAKILPEKEVILVHILFRLGHRTPVDTYPRDPYVNETFYPYGWGQLTNSGKKYLYEMGTFLRLRYNKFLGRVYQPDYLYAQTTNKTRTRMSMLVVLAGLWPPKNSPNEWNRKLNWQPIPIESESVDRDALLLGRTSCSRYVESVQEVLNATEIKSQITPYSGMMEELTEKTGLKIKTPNDVQSLFSTLKAEQEYKLQLPEWMRQFYPDRLLSLTKLSYIWNVYTPEMKRLTAGPFLQKLTTEWKAASEGRLEPKNRKMYLYAGHDSSVVNVLHALGVWDVQLPDYAIMTIFELVHHFPTQKFGIQLYLRNSTAMPVPLILPGCDFFCPLEKALALIAPLLPDNQEEECKPKDPSYTAPPSRVI